MRTNKIASVLCAVALLISALPAASAAEKEPLSQYAGQTITVQAVEVTDDGMVSRLVEVAIPEGATETDEYALIQAAVHGQEAISPLSANSGSAIPYFFSEETNIRVTKTPTKVGGGVPLGEDMANIRKVEISVNIGEVGLSHPAVSFQVRDAANYDRITPWNTITISSNAQKLTITMKDIASTDKGIEVFAKTVVDTYVVFSSCLVRGYTI